MLFSHKLNNAAKECCWYCLNNTKSGFPFSACPLANASFKTAGQVEILGHSPDLVNRNYFHLQEMNKTLNFHRSIFLTCGGKITEC